MRSTIVQYNKEEECDEQSCQKKERRRSRRGCEYCDATGNHDASLQYVCTESLILGDASLFSIKARVSSGECTVLYIQYPVRSSPYFSPDLARGAFGFERSALNTVLLGAGASVLQYSVASRCIVIESRCQLSTLHLKKFYNNHAA